MNDFTTQGGDDPLAALANEVGEVFGVTKAPDSAPAPAEPAAPAEAPPLGEATPPTAAPGEGAVAPSPSPAPEAPQGAAPAPQPSGLEVPSGQVPAAPAPGQPAPAAPPAPNEAALELASLRAQVTSLEQRLAAAGTQPKPASPAAQPGQQPGQPGSSPEEETPPQYGFVIPDQLGAALTSENPQEVLQGITVLVNSLAANIHKALRQEYSGRLATMRSEIESAVRAPQIAAQKEQMQNEYFTDFPQHKNPLIQPILEQTASELAAQFPGAVWDANYRAALGSRVNAKLLQLGVPTGAPAPTPAPTAPTPAKPAAFTPTAPRQDSIVPTADASVEGQVAEVFELR